MPSDPYWMVFTVAAEGNVRGQPVGTRIALPRQYVLLIRELPDGTTRIVVPGGDCYTIRESLAELIAATSPEAFD